MTNYPPNRFLECATGILPVCGRTTGGTPVGHSARIYPEFTDNLTIPFHLSRIPS